MKCSLTGRNRMYECVWNEKRKQYNKNQLGVCIYDSAASFIGLRGDPCTLVCAFLTKIRFCCFTFFFFLFLYCCRSFSTRCCAVSLYFSGAVHIRQIILYIVGKEKKKRKNSYQFRREREAKAEKKKKIIISMVRHKPYTL